MRGDDGGEKATPIRDFSPPRGPSPGHAFERGTATPYRRTHWSPETAYVVGLIATDGNLSGNGRRVSITSKDLDLLETVRACLGL